MGNTVEQEVVGIIADVSGYDETKIRHETNLADELEIDSIKAIEIVVFIEKKFKISLRDEDIAKITTVKQIIDLTGQMSSEQYHGM